MRKLCFKETGRFFFVTWRWELFPFREWTFFGQNIDIRAVIFSWEIEKKGHPLWLFFTKIECSFDKIDVFWPIMCTTAGVFHEKLKKNHMRALCFWDNGRFFFTNMGMRALCFLENRRIFDKYWQESSDIFVKKRNKKGILLTFMTIK